MRNTIGLVSKLLLLVAIFIQVARAESAWSAQTVYVHDPIQTRIECLVASEPHAYVDFAGFSAVSKHQDSAPSTLDFSSLHKLKLRHYHFCVLHQLRNAPRPAPCHPLIAMLHKQHIWHQSSDEDAIPPFTRPAI